MTNPRTPGRFIGCGCGGCRPGLSRRGFVAAAASVLAAAPRRASAQTGLTPDAAFARLMDGNRRFVERRLTFLDEDLGILRQGTAENQEPFAAVLACADLRVPVGLVFDQSIGHLFVARVAGNIVSPEIIASLEYGAAVLGTPVDPRAGSFQLRGGEGSDRRQAGTRPDQRAVPRDPPGGGPGRRPCGGDPGQRARPGAAAAEFIPGDRRSGEAKAAFGPCRLLRSGKRTRGADGALMAVSGTRQGGGKSGAVTASRRAKWAEIVWSLKLAA